ncbi:MAG: NtrC-family two-component system sensor histidine kinase KinB, partial [Candidatus Promineifilaceae bacterium]
EVYVPIQMKGKTDGVLAFGDDKSYSFSEDDVTLIESVAEAASLAITNAHLFQEISEQQGRLEALINSSNDGIILIGQNQDILVVNQPALDLLNLYHQPTDWLKKPVSELSKNLLSAGFPEFSEIFLNQLASIQSADPANFQTEPQEYELASNIVSISFLPVTGKEGYIGCLYVIRDITEEKLLTRMRNDLTHSIVHDLKNPLWMLDTGLKLLTDALHSQGALGETETQMLDISSTQVERMLRLVNAILDISQLEDRKMPLSREVFDIRTLIDESMHLMKPEAKKKNILLESNYSALAELVNIDADKELISRVLQNLVGNSLKFTPENGTIYIACQLNSELRVINIRVKDTGPGIRSNMTAHIFEKFVTGDHDESGSGLGLAFCKMAVEAHDGTIEVEETSSDGTIFRFSLPLSGTALREY